MKTSRIDVIGANGPTGAHYALSHLVKCVGHGCTKKSECSRYVKNTKGETMFAQTPQLLPYGRGCQFFTPKGKD